VTQGHPVVERYMARFETSIRELDSTQRREIAQEIRNHIAEASAAGKGLDAVLESLGPADTLARAYAVELLVNPRDRRLAAVGGFLKMAGIVAAGSLATLLVVVTLGGFGITFVASAVTFLVIGVLEAMGIHLSGVQLAGIAPVWIIALAPVLLVIGIGCLALLTAYVRFLAHSLKRVLPRYPYGHG
jgi:uncharacterized membrane protein